MRYHIGMFRVLPLLLCLVACSGTEGEHGQAADSRPSGATMRKDLETATLAAGCFWCVEAVLQQVPGVARVRSGYTGGSKPNPTYKEVCTGETGHAEAVQVEFDPKVLSYEKLLDWFFRLHDPTTLNRQGADEGTQYRSAIYWHTEAQKAAAEKLKRELDQGGAFLAPIVTEIAKAGEFYAAENYHQDYYRQNQDQGYCRIVIRPKLEKLGLQK
jgi:peptide-methionine (S)-S-oxide reductase